MTAVAPETYLLDLLSRMRIGISSTPGGRRQRYRRSRNPSHHQFRSQDAQLLNGVNAYCRRLAIVARGQLVCRRRDVTKNTCTRGKDGFHQEAPTTSSPTFQTSLSRIVQPRSLAGLANIDGGRWWGPCIDLTPYLEHTLSGVCIS